MLVFLYKKTLVMQYTKNVSCKASKVIFLV